MPGRDINKEILINTIKSDYSNGTSKAVEILKRNYPELSQQRCENIIELINEAITSNEAFFCNQRKNNNERCSINA